MPGAAGAAGTQCTAGTAQAGSVLLRSAFREHAAGVAVITAWGAQRPAGFTATSLSSASAEPPLICFGVGAGSSSWPVIEQTEHVGVHMLAAGQHELAAVFARRGADRFAPPTRWRSGPFGVPLLEDVNAWLVCRILSRVPAGDHRMVLAEVVAGESAEGGRPLVYHRGRFGTLA